MYTLHIHSEKNRNKLLTKIKPLPFSFIISIFPLSLACFIWNSLSHQQSQSKARFLVFAQVFSMTHFESGTYQRLNFRQVSETFPHIFDWVHLESQTYQSEVNFAPCLWSSFRCGMLYSMVALWLRKKRPGAVVPLREGSKFFRTWGVDPLSL